MAKSMPKRQPLGQPLGQPASRAVPNAASKEASRTRTQPARQAVDPWDALERVLQEQIRVQGEAAELIRAQTVALRDGQADEIDAMHQQRERLLHGMAQLQHQQRAAIAGVARTLGKTSNLAQPVRLLELIEAAPAPRRERLIAMRERLRSEAEQAQGRARVAGRAAESLVRHVNGIVRNLAHSASGRPAYTRHGTPDMPVGALNTFTVTG